jgi:hypothetical protein
MAKPTLSQEKARYYRLLKDPLKKVIWTTHIRVRMSQWDIVAEEIGRILTMGQVVWFETVYDDTVHVLGRTRSGRFVKVIVGLRDQRHYEPKEMVLINVIEPDGKRKNDKW